MIDFSNKSGVEVWFCSAINQNWLFFFLGLQLQSLSGTIPGKHYSSFSISGAGCCKGGHEQDTSSCIELFLAAVLSVFRVTVKIEAVVLGSEKSEGKSLNAW